jgi:GNAT superfamily N-acetyltransferase
VSLASLLDATELPGAIVASPVESRRFDLSVGRLDVGPSLRCEADDLLDLVERAAPDVVIGRIPAERVSWPARLARGRRTVFHADSLVYWDQTLDPRASTFAPTPYRVVGTEDRASVEALARATFHDYPSHYLANPLFRAEDVGAGFGEWAASFVDGPGRALITVADGGWPGAFAAIELAADHGEICLAGVSPQARGRGYYHEILASAERYVADRGLHTIVISTQVHNVPVQRVWAGRGYRPILAFETMHFVAPGLLTRGADEEAAR